MIEAQIKLLRSLNAAFYNDIDSQQIEEAKKEIENCEKNLLNIVKNEGFAELCGIYLELLELRKENKDLKHLNKQLRDAYSILHGKIRWGET